tara:strand:+ start:1514 stop:2311 length:798 start_codon:yes stop_codon:yes gene_type:complete
MSYPNDVGDSAPWTIDSIRREILRLTQDAPYHKPDFYRSFTTRLKEIFGNYQVAKGDGTLRDVEIIYANPERAIATITQGKNIQLPMLSLGFEGIEVDEKRRRPLENLSQVKYWDHTKQRAVRYMALAPVAANLTYSLNVWGKYVEDVNQLTENIILAFRPNLVIDIKKNQTYNAFLGRVDESSQLTVGDREDRIIKRQIKFTVEGYVPSQVFKFSDTGEIASMSFDVYKKETEGMSDLETFKGNGSLQVSSYDRMQTATTIPEN